MKLRATQFGVPSPRHAKSEDALTVKSLAEGGALGVLSDGVGAARDPRRCADRVVRLVGDHFAARPAHWTIHQSLARLAEEANASLHREGAYLDGTSSMLATLSVVHVNANRLTGLNVGDSPVWLFRGEECRRLTEPHVQRNADGRELLTRAIGMANALNPYRFETPLQTGDRILMASDGLTQLINEDTVAEFGRRLPTARTILQAALDRSGATDFDDLSAILLEVEELDDALETADAPTARGPLAKGMEVDGFTLLRSMAETRRVWLAEKNDARFILKFIPEEAARDESGELQSRFNREIANACRFDGPEFVRGRRPESGATDYYIMDYVEAPSLRFFLKTRRLTSEEAVDLGVFLCRTGQFLLRRDLVHGDIKPDNVLIPSDSSGHSFKLLDLGIATSVFTDSGLAGTATYLAPERFQGAVVTERTEIYSIGATLYELLTGQPPQGEIERFQKPRFHSPRRPSQANVNVAPWLDAILLKCLSEDPARRYQHFSELEFTLTHPSAAPAPVFEPLLGRDPLRFYQIGFWILLILCLTLLLLLIS